MISEGTRENAFLLLVWLCVGCMYSLYVVFGFGRYGQLPLNTAFLDRSVLRIPKFTDIEAFIKRFADPPSTTTPPSQQSVSPSGKEKTHERDMGRAKNEEVEKAKREKGVATGGGHEEKNQEREEKRTLSLSSSSSSSSLAAARNDSMVEGLEDEKKKKNEKPRISTAIEGSEEVTDTGEERLKKEKEERGGETEESVERENQQQDQELLTNENTMNEEGQDEAGASVEDPSFLESEEAVERQEIDSNLRDTQGEGNEEERQMQMKKAEKKSERDRKFEEDIDHHNFLILNPFNEFLMRFNYTEVDNITSYAEELTKELRNSPLTFQHK